MLKCAMLGTFTVTKIMLNRVFSQVNLLSQWYTFHFIKNLIELSAGKQKTP